MIVSARYTSYCHLSLGRLDADLGQAFGKAHLQMLRSPVATVHERCVGATVPVPVGYSGATSKLQR